MIIVTGATGRLGRLIVEKLVDHVPAHQVGASVREPRKAADLEPRGVRVRHGDFDDPASLRHAFEGAAQVLIVSSNARASGGDALRQHRSAIEAARAVGARRIVYTSHMAASASSAFPPMLDHAATEAMLEQSGLAWTALRNGFYAATGLALMGDALETGLIEQPSGRQGFVDDARGPGRDRRNHSGRHFEGWESSRRADTAAHRIRGARPCRPRWYRVEAAGPSHPPASHQGRGAA